MKLHVFPPSPRARKAMAVTTHLQLPVEFVPLDLLKGEQRQPEYLKLNPNGRMPTLQDGDFTLWESNAILLYLAEKKPGLLPTDIQARAQVNQWLCWELAHWEPACATLLYEYVIKPMVLKSGEPDPAKVEEGSERLLTFGRVLDQQLGKHKYVAGDALSVADFALAAPLEYAVPARFPLDGFANIQRWHADIQQLDAWQKTAPPPLG